MKKLIICSLFLLSSSWLMAQTHYVEGFIIKHEGDTIYGLIDSRGDRLMHSICHFKKHKESEVEAFEPTEIAAYRLAQGKFYVAKEYENKYYFFEYLVNGELDIYYLRTAKKDEYFIEKEGQPFTLLPFEEGTVYRNDVEYAYKSTQHQGVLGFYTEDAPVLSNRIKSIEQPTHRDLIKLAKSYHEISCTDGGSCIIYEKKIPSFSVQPELSIGFIQNNNYGGLKQQFSQIGILAHIWLPRLNEKLYFKTGVQKFNSRYEEESFNLYKFPVQLEYVFPKWLVRPTVAYGVNIYNVLGLTNGLNLGVQVDIMEKIKLRLSAEMEFLPRNIIIVPESFLFQSYNIGLYFNL